VSSPPPVPTDRGRGLSPAERRELREAALTVVPAVALGVALRWTLAAYAGWEPRRAMLAGVGAGIALAVLVLRTLRRPARR
jgi:hypothetical protein